MLNTQQALLQYLNTGKNEFFPTIKAIKKYRGEIARAAAQDEKIRKFADPLPAIYVLMVEGNPIAFTPVKNFDLMVITESRVFDVERKEYDNLVIIDGICNFIDEHPHWNYNNEPYLIDRDKVKVRTILSDARFIIFAISLEIHNAL
jgi:hypothetical protein